jgi:hypothetical protein
MPKTIFIFDRSIHEAHRVNVEASGDVVAFSFVDSQGVRQYREISGEHGLNDYNQWGFSIGWTHPEELTDNHIVYH